MNGPARFDVLDYFHTVAEAIEPVLSGDELYTCSFSGEDSDFVRFNGGAVRQGSETDPSDGVPTQIFVW